MDANALFYETIMGWRIQSEGFNRHHVALALEVIRTCLSLGLFVPTYCLKVYTPYLDLSHIHANDGSAMHVCMYVVFGRTIL